MKINTFLNVQNLDTDSERENERKIFYDMMYKVKENITDEHLM